MLKFGDLVVGDRFILVTDASLAFSNTPVYQKVVNNHSGGADDDLH